MHFAHASSPIDSFLNFIITFVCNIRLIFVEQNKGNKEIRPSSFSYELDRLSVSVFAIRHTKEKKCKKFKNCVFWCSHSAMERHSYFCSESCDIRSHSATLYSMRHGNLFDCNWCQDKNPLFHLK